MKTNLIIIIALVITIVGALYIGVDMGAVRNRINRAIRLSAPSDKSSSVTSDSESRSVVVGATDPGQTHKDIHNTHQTSGNESDFNLFMGASKNAPPIGALLSQNTGVESSSALQEQATRDKQESDRERVAMDTVTTVPKDKGTKLSDEINATKFGMFVRPHDRHRVAHLEHDRESRAMHVVPKGDEKKSSTKDELWNYYNYLTSSSGVAGSGVDQGGYVSSSQTPWGSGASTDAPLIPSDGGGIFGGNGSGQRRFPALEPDQRRWPVVPSSNRVAQVSPYAAHLGGSNDPKVRQEAESRGLVQSTGPPPSAKQQQKAAKQR